MHKVQLGGSCTRRLAAALKNVHDRPRRRLIRLVQDAESGIYVLLSASLSLPRHVSASLIELDKTTRSLQPVPLKAQQR